MPLVGRPTVTVVFRAAIIQTYYTIIWYYVENFETIKSKFRKHEKFIIYYDASVYNCIIFEQRRPLHPKVRRDGLLGELRTLGLRSPIRGNMRYVHLVQLPWISRKTCYTSPSHSSYLKETDNALVKMSIEYASKAGDKQNCLKLRGNMRWIVGWNVNRY